MEKYYYIDTPDDLADVLGKYIQENETCGNHFIIRNNLDCSGITNFTPLGSGTNFSFDGELDGDGHMITNLTVNPRQMYDLGFFTKIGIKGKVKNLRFEAISILQNSEVMDSVTTTRAGVIAAVCQGEIYGCSARGGITLQANTDICQVGGLCGSLPFIASAISNSWADVSISFQVDREENFGNGNDKSYSAGGIAGSVNGHISSSHSRSEISGPPDKIADYTAGGICGEAESCSKVTDCYNIGYLHSRTMEGDVLGGIAGKALGDAVFTRCFYLRGCLLSKNNQKAVETGDTIGTAKKWKDLTDPGFAQSELVGNFADTPPDDYTYTPSLVLFTTEGINAGATDYHKALCTPVAVSFTQSVYPNTVNPVKIVLELSDCSLSQVSMTAVKRDRSSNVFNPPVSDHSFSWNLGNNIYVKYDFVLTLKDKYDRVIALSDVDIEMKV